MKKIIYIAFTIICFSVVGLAQETLNFKTGKNFTKYSYVDKQGDVPNEYLQTDVGNWYSLGYTIPMSDNKKAQSLFTYEAAVSVGDYNSVVGIKGANLQWKTVFVGLDNSLLISLVKLNNIALKARLGFNMATIVFGKENIDGVIYDIKNADGFRGVTFQGVLGLQLNLFQKKSVFYSLGYDSLRSLNTSVQSPEKLSLTTNRIWVGINLNISN